MQVLREISAQSADSTTATSQAIAKLADLSAALRKSITGFRLPGGTTDTTGMHRTATVDYALMLQGELVAIMDEEETALRAGDVLIQRGTNHAWANRSGQPARIAFILIDAQ